MGLVDGILLLLVMCTVPVCSVEQVKRKFRQPNIVMMVADDLGELIV